MKEITWKQLQQKVDNLLEKTDRNDIDIYYLDTHNYPQEDRVDIHITEQGLIIQS